MRSTRNPTYSFPVTRTSRSRPLLVSAASLRPPGSVRAPTSVGLDLPAFYAVVGLPSLVTSTASGVYLMRIVSALICAALLASALMSLRSVVPGWLAATGLGFALTPMTAFLSGTVNPNGLEICAAIGAWASGAVLAHNASTRVDGLLVRRTAIAMAVLVLMRGLSPLWLGIIAVTCLALASRAGLRNLAASASVRRWGVLVIGASLFTVAWVVIVRPLDNLYRHGPDPGPVGVATLVPPVVRHLVRPVPNDDREGRMARHVSAGSHLRVVDLVLGALVVMAIAFASRRHAAIVVVLAGLSIVVPVLIDVSQARKIGLGWQGRWTLPLAVGVPIVAALALAWSSRRKVLERPWVPVVLAACFVVAQFAAFAQTLRRYTVGAHGPLDFWLHPSWSPPVPTWLLLGTALVVLVVLATLIWRPADADDPMTQVRDEDLGLASTR